MAFIPFLLSLITVIVIVTANKFSQNLVIYVDSMNGTMDINCWTSGLEQPCQNLEIALEGAKQIKDSAIMTLQPTSCIVLANSYSCILCCMQKLL